MNNRIIRAANPGGMRGYIPPIFDLHPPNNFDFCPASPNIFPPYPNNLETGRGDIE